MSVKYCAGTDEHSSVRLAADQSLSESHLEERNISSSLAAPLFLDFFTSNASVLSHALGVISSQTH